MPLDHIGRPTGEDEGRGGGFLRHELKDHFGLDAPGLRPEAMAARVIAWWESVGLNDDVAGV